VQKPLADRHHQASHRSARQGHWAPPGTQHSVFYYGFYPAEQGFPVIMAE
jgi:hypothetical protein